MCWTMVSRRRRLRLLSKRSTPQRNGKSKPTPRPRTSRRLRRRRRATKRIRTQSGNLRLPANNPSPLPAPTIKRTDKGRQKTTRPSHLPNREADKTARRVSDSIIRTCPTCRTVSARPSSALWSLVTERVRASWSRRRSARRRTERRRLRGRKSRGPRRVSSDNVMWGRVWLDATRWNSGRTLMR